MEKPNELNVDFAGFESDDENNKKKVTKKAKKQTKEPESEHPLITDLDYRDKEQKKTHKAELWFQRDIFQNLINEQDEDADLDKMVEEYKKKGANVVGEKTRHNCLKYFHIFNPHKH